jgi:hypothetical protein
MTADGPLMKMPPEEMLKVALRYACGELYKAEEALYGKADMPAAMSCLFNSMKALGPFITDGPAQALAMQADQMKAMLTKQYAFNQPQPSIATGVPHAHAGASDPAGGTGKGNPGDLTKKGGPQFTSERMSKLEGMLEVLSSLMAEVRPVEQAAPAPTVEEPTAADEVTDDVADDSVSPAAQEALTKMAGLIKSLKVENAELRNARPFGNAASDGGDTPKPTTRAKVHWPDDLNDLDDSGLA